MNANQYVAALYDFFNCEYAGKLIANPVRGSGYYFGRRWLTIIPDHNLCEDVSNALTGMCPAMLSQHTFTRTVQGKLATLLEDRVSPLILYPSLGPILTVVQENKG